MKKINVVVKKRFLDKYAGVYRKPGEKLTVDGNRFREIKRKGDYVEIETAKAPEKAPEIKK